MSVILDALKGAEKDKAEKLEGKTNLNEGEGIFKGKRSVVVSPSLSLPKIKVPKNIRMYLLAGALVTVLAFSVTMWLIRRGGSVPQYQLVVPPPAAVIPPMDDGRETMDERRVTSDEIRQAIEAFNKGDYEKSAALLKGAIEKNPNDARLHNSMGLVFAKKGLYSNASSEYQKALELDDKCAECYNNLGHLKSLLNESVEAIKYFEKAISLSSANPEPYFNVAVLYEKEGDIGSAVKYYRQFVELYPQKNDGLLQKVTKRIEQLTGR